MSICAMQYKDACTFFGEFEPVITRYVKETLKPGDVFIDIRANVGYYSLLAAKLVGPSGASPKIFGMLKSNLARN